MLFVIDERPSEEGALGSGEMLGGLASDTDKCSYKERTRGVLEEGEGGSERGGGLTGTPPSSQGPPVVPAKGGPKHFEASILLAPKAPKQNFGFRPQTLEGEEGGGVPPLLLRFTAVLIHHWGWGRLGPKSWCTKMARQDKTRQKILFCPAMVPLVWGGGGGGADPPPAVGLSPARPRRSHESSTPASAPIVVMTVTSVVLVHRARPDFPNGKFRFVPRWSLWSWGGGGGAGPPPAV